MGGKHRHCRWSAISSGGVDDERPIEAARVIAWFGQVHRADIQASIFAATHLGNPFQCVGGYVFGDPAPVSRPSRFGTLAGASGCCRANLAGRRLRKPCESRPRKEPKCRGSSREPQLPVRTPLVKTATEIGTWLRWRRDFWNRNARCSIPRPRTEPGTR